jgi:hypothetical protein
MHKSKRDKFKENRDEIKNRGLISPLTTHRITMVNNKLTRKIHTMHDKGLVSLE